MCRVVTIVGAVLGWIGAVVVGFGGFLPHEQSEPFMLLGLSVALLSSACLVLQRHQRPLGAAFELGYDMGRRDAMRDANKSNVTPIRRTLSDYGDSVGL